MFKYTTASNKNNERDREVGVRAYSDHDLIYLETQPLVDLKNLTKEKPEDLHYLCLNVEEACDLAHAILDGIRVLKLGKELILKKGE